MGRSYLFVRPNTLISNKSSVDSRVLSIQDRREFKPDLDERMRKMAKFIVLIRLDIKKKKFFNKVQYH